MFALQIPRAGSGQSEEPVTLFRSPVRMPEAQALAPSSTDFPGVLAGR